MRTSSTCHKGPACRQAGFTLVELIVTIAIMAALTTVVFYNQGSYSNTIALSNQATDVALSVRQAQVYGISVKETTPGSGDFSAHYGIEFSIQNVQSRSLYYFFADKSPYNNAYDGDALCTTGGGSECISRTNLSDNIKFEKFCEIKADSTEDCTVSRVDLTYWRPSPQAHFMFYDSLGNPMFTPTALGARVVLQAVSGLEKSVIVYTTGQVSVQ